MRAVEYRKSVPRYLAARFLSRRWPRLATGSLGTLRLVDRAPPRLPGPAWVSVRPRLSGICGSDLATVTAAGSPYFSPLLSYPFVLGHEVVGEIARIGGDVTRFTTGQRVVLEPALGCAVRQIDPPCRACEGDAPAACERVTDGVISAGIQTGFCRDTGGAWSDELVAHEGQLHPVDDAVSDAALVLCEPLACAIHAAIRVPPPPDGEMAIVLGCGTVGLLVIAALRALGSRARVAAIVRHPHQETLARSLGADDVWRLGGRALREKAAEASGARSLQPEIGRPIFVGGAPVVYDCVGSASSIDDAVRFTRARGRVALVGMPAIPSGIDWTAIWYKEITVHGCYAYGVETWSGRKVRTFELALQILGRNAAALEALVGARFPLERYREAIASALDTGRSAAAKTVFELERTS